MTALGARDSHRVDPNPSSHCVGSLSSLQHNCVAPTHWWRRLRHQCVRATQLCCKELKLPTQCELGLVHLLIYTTFCRVGKSSVECTDGLDHPTAVARLHRYKKTFPSGSLQYVPVLYICPSGAHALHLETYVCWGTLGSYAHRPPASCLSTIHRAGSPHRAARGPPRAERAT